LEVRESFVVDAHALAWFISQDAKLGAMATNILRKAEETKAEILVPTVVLAEILYISERKKVSVEIGEVMRRMIAGKGFAIVPFDLMVFEEMIRLPRELEIHDRIIAATSKIYGAKVITRDEELSKVVEAVW
jgi:predicted nucleic acid-binding protein